MGGEISTQTNNNTNNNNNNNNTKKSIVKNISSITTCVSGFNLCVSINLTIKLNILNNYLSNI